MIRPVPGTRARHNARHGARHPAANIGRRRLVAAALGALLLAGCSNSKFLVGMVYDRADSKALSEAEEWVELTPQQRQEFQAYIGTFHTWHRRAELPRYAALMRDMTRGLSTWDQATPADFTRWIDAARLRTEALRDCHPARFATPLTHTLSDAQIDDIERTWRERRAENLERAADTDRSERIARRVRNIDTWVGRLGVDLDPDQLELLQTAFTRQISLHEQYRALSDEWNETMLALVRDRSAPDYDARIDAHVGEWFGMLKQAHPEQWAANRLLWRDTAVAFEKTLSRQQRRDALRWVNKMADTLDAVSQDTPDWLPADDPAYGCTVEQGAAAAGDGGEA